MRTLSHTVPKPVIKKYPDIPQQLTFAIYLLSMWYSHLIPDYICCLMLFGCRDAVIAKSI